MDMLKGLNFVAIISLMGWGLGYFGQPHVLARFMAADSHHSIVHARRISMTWMILCLAGAVAVGFFGIAYFNEHPAVAGAVNQNAERVFIELAQILFNPWIAGIFAVGDSGGGNVNVKLPAAGMFQCDYRRFIQSVSA